MKEVALYQVVSLEQGTPSSPIYCDSQEAYFGSGYYFWEHSIDVAHHYGTKHYGGSRYIICKSHYDRHSDKYFDIVGCSEHIELLLHFHQRLQWQLGDDYTVGKLIRAIREIERFGFDKLFWAIKAKPINKCYIDRKLDIPIVATDPKRGLISLGNRIQVCVLNLEFLLNNQRYDRVFPELSYEDQLI